MDMRRVDELESERARESVCVCVLGSGIVEVLVLCSNLKSR